MHVLTKKFGLREGIDFIPYKVKSLVGTGITDDCAIYVKINKENKHLLDELEETKEIIKYYDGSEVCTLKILNGYGHGWFEGFFEIWETVKIQYI